MCYLLFTDLFQQNINAANAVMQSRGHYYAERTNLCSQVYAMKKLQYWNHVLSVAVVVISRL